MVEWFPDKPKAPFVPLHPFYGRVGRHFNETFPRTFRPYKLIRELNPNNTYMKQCFLVTGRFERMSGYHLFGHIISAFGLGYMAYGFYRFVVWPTYKHIVQPWYNSMLSHVQDIYYNPDETYYGLLDRQQAEI